MLNGKRGGRVSGQRERGSMNVDGEDKGAGARLKWRRGDCISLRLRVGVHLDEHVP